MRSSVLRTACLATFVLFAATIAHADPITVRTITSGQVTSGGLTGAGNFFVGGDAFALSGSFSGLGPAGCAPCAAGQSTSFRAGSLDLDLRTLAGVVDGVSYPRLFPGGHFEVASTQSVIIPANATTGTVLTFPFATSSDANLIGYTDQSRTQAAFTLPLLGSGTASVSLHLDQVLNGTPIFSTQDFVWTFATPAATPEPATILLTGTACLLLAGRRARRRPSR